MRSNRAFTLIEMVVVIGIILIISGIALPSISATWNQSTVSNADKRITNLLRLSHAYSLDMTKHYSSGLLFYVDPDTGKQTVVFIKSKPIANKGKGEVVSDVCDRYEVDYDAISFLSTLEPVVRIAPSDLMKWEEEEIFNNDHLLGKHRNFFAIVFSKGSLGSNHRGIIIYDEDKDEDGIGDFLKLPVSDTIGKFGGPLNDILASSDDTERRLWGTVRSFIVYSELDFQEFSDTDILELPYNPVLITRDGQNIRVQKEIIQ